MKETKFISVTQAAERLKVTPHFIRKLIREGKLSAEQSPRNSTYQIETKSFEEYRGNDSYQQDLELLSKGFEISNREAVVQLEDYYGDVISYISIPGSPFSMLDQNDCIFLDDLLFKLIPINKGDNGKKFKKLTLFLHSGGGILEASVKFSTILRHYAETYEVIVPMMAKSAATLLALNGDEIYFTSLSELGPVDPIIQSPTNPGLRIPATSIEDFIQSYGTVDETTTANTLALTTLKKKFEENLDPYLLGSYVGALRYSKDQIKHALENFSMKGKDQQLINVAVEEFTTKHHSHSHPITPDELKIYGIGKVINNETELKVIKTLQGFYQQFMGMNNIVKLIGQRDENRFVQAIQSNAPQSKQVNAVTEVK